MKNIIFFVIISVFVFSGCATTTVRFHERDKPMKESCVLFFKSGAIHYIVNVNDNSDRKRINDDPIGAGTVDYILPIGTYWLQWSYTAEVETTFGDHTYSRWVYNNITRANEIRYFKRDTIYASSEKFEFESGKRYHVVRRGNTITIKEMDKGAKISKNGTLVRGRKHFHVNYSALQYYNGFNLGEYGQQFGMSIVNDSMIMNLNLFEYSLGLGFWGIPDYFSIGFPVRLGGSITTRFNKIGLGLGGGLLGQIMVHSPEDYVNDSSLLSGFPVVPYIQLKGFLKEEHVLGLFIEYYPTVKPIGIGTFGVGVTVHIH